MAEKQSKRKPVRKKEADDVSSVAGSVESAQIESATGPAVGEGARVIDTGGGAYIGGKVTVAGGDFVGRDQVKAVGLTKQEIADLFKPIYTAIDVRRDTPPQERDDLKAEVEEIQAEVAKDEDAKEVFLARRLRNLKRMAPDVLDVVLATLTNPAAGLGAVARKVAEKMKAEAS
jgi:hypothetical protein